MLGPHRKACLGMRQLEEAVLEVLFEAKRNGECPGVAEISRTAGDMERERRYQQRRARQRNAVDRLGDRPEIVSGRARSNMREIARTERIQADGVSVRSDERQRGTRLGLARGGSGRVRPPVPDIRAPAGTHREQLPHGIHLHDHHFHEIGEDSLLGHYRDACQRAAEPRHTLHVRQSRQMAPALPHAGAPGVRDEDRWRFA